MPDVKIRGSTFEDDHKLETASIDRHRFMYKMMPILLRLYVILLRVNAINLPL